MDKKAQIKKVFLTFLIALVLVATTYTAGIDLATATTAGSSYDITVAGKATGSAVFFGMSGTPFCYFAYGTKY